MAIKIHFSVPLGCLLLLACHLHGLSSSSSPSSSSISGSSSSLGSDKIQNLNPIEKPQTPKQALPVSRPPIKLPVPVNQVASYFHPGVLVWRNNTWEGGDDLLNLNRNIGVYV